MCGIVTIFNYNSNEPVDREELTRIRDYMIKRGPDGKGEWYSSDNRVGMGHRRLAIIDLSDTGAQPMNNEDGTIWITFNGEIYNYKELGDRLRVMGHRFKSDSDTEVIIHGYEEWGIEGVLEQLRGMFAFALHDSRSSGSFSASDAPRLIIARDPFGIKPLYYADDGKTIRVASQVKALLAGEKINTSPDPAGHVGFFLWGHVPEPYTLYRGIRSLPAGSYMCVTSKSQHSALSSQLQATRTPNPKPSTYCSIPQIFANAEENHVVLSKEEMHERLRAALLDSVEHHLVADVPVGVFLSAGIDSGTLVGLASEVEKSRLHTVTLAFKEYEGTDNDEAVLASLVAEQYQTIHETVRVEKKDFRDEMDAILQAMDQPTTDGVNSYFVSKAAVRAGLKVAMSGLGGDELFGGYPSFRQVPRMASILKGISGLPGLGKTFRVVSSPVMRRMTSPKYAGLLEYGGSYGGAYLLRRGMFMPWELPQFLDGEMVKEGWRELQTLLRLEDTLNGIRSDYFKVSSLEISWYMRNQLLRDADWASMAHSLEVRVPLVDVSLLRALRPMLSAAIRPSKQDLALTPLNPLSDSILSRDKTGFSVPVREWMMEDNQSKERGLRGWAKQIYGAEYGALSGFGSFPKKNRTTPGNAPMALVFRTGQLGDTLVSMPAIKAIRENYPNHKLILLTDRHPNNNGYVSSWDVLGPTGWFADVVYYVPAKGAIYKLSNMTSLINKLRGLAPEYVFDLAPERTKWQSNRDRFFFRRMVGASNYRGYGAFRKMGKNADGYLPRMEPEWRRLLKIVGGDAGPSFCLPIPARERMKVQTLCKAEGVSLGKRVVAMGPGSKMPAKRWPKERYAELGNLLLKTFSDLQLVVLGGKEDKELGDELCAAWGSRSFNFAGQLSVYGSAVVLERCCGYVGNDTGTMHLAGVVGTRCVALFSARDYPGQWEPYGDMHVILRLETSCAGCMLEECEKYHNECLNRISVGDVFKEVEGLLAPQNRQPVSTG